MLLLRPEVIASRLADLGIVTVHQLEQARQEWSVSQERFSLILSRQGLLRDPDAGKRLAVQLGAIAQPVEIPAQLPPAAAQIPDAVWAAQRLAPLREQEGKLLLATDDPLSVFSLEPLSRRYGCALEAVLVSEAELARLMTKTESAPGLLPARPAVNVSKPQAPVKPATFPDALPKEDEPIIKLVDSMLSQAVRMRASDVHIQSDSRQVRVRYRIDGVLRDVNTPPKALHGPIISRIKIMAGMNIAEKRLPQDGRLQITVDHHPLDVRISTLPASHGESAVLRLLDRGQPLRGVAELGMGEDDQRLWGELIHRPHGMVLVTGPTGSGKTTTLYGALAVLNTPDRKLITVEDPVEYQLPGVNQVSVKSAIGLTFSAGLRSMLRQAPDVIMVGEIRDQDTARIAIQAALTGHLVLSTLHTNDAPSAITRLIDMGVAPFLVASTIQGILAQRLVRRVCASCRMTANATEEEKAFLKTTEPIQLIHGVGCDSCQGTGFLGRVGLFELLAVNTDIRKLIVEKVGASTIRKAAVSAGMRGLLEDGCAKIHEGWTTMPEVLRVVNAMEE